MNNRTLTAIMAPFLSYWCIRPIYAFGPVRPTAMPDHSMNSQTTREEAATPRKQYPWCQGPSLKEKPKQEANQWGEGSEDGIIPVARLLEQGPGFLTIPVRPSFPSHTPPHPPPPLCTELWVASKLTPGPGKEEGEGGGEGGEVSPGQTAES